MNSPNEVNEGPGSSMSDSAQKPQRSAEEITRWLEAHHGAAVTELAPLGGGFWSSAFGYRVGDDALVLRLGDQLEGFTIDAAAADFAGPGLPIPEVLKTGDALDLRFAISRRHYGRFLETAEESEGDAVGRALTGLLNAMRSVPSAPDAPVIWYDPRASVGMTWHAWLLGGLADDPAAQTGGWKAKLSADPELDEIFRACEARILELLPACPERRDLVHGDLLHQNVLIAEDASRVTAVFSWKCSARGDFLFDVAWCTLWSDWHPGIAAADVWGRTLADASLGANDLADAPLRHHCYELQIAASHLGWYTWTGDAENLARLAGIAGGLLARGPLAG